MTEMITHPIHGDMILDIDQISVIPEPMHQTVNLHFIGRMNVRHEITLDMKTARELIKALRHATTPDEYHPMAIRIEE